MGIIYFAATKNAMFDASFYISLPISYIFCDYNLCGYLLSLCLNAVCSNDNNSDYLVGR